MQVSRVLQQTLDDLLPEHASEALKRLKSLIKQYRKGRKRNGPKDAVLAAYNFLDETYARNTPIKQISCRKGCSFCCHTNVDVTADEAEVLISYAKQHNIPIDQKYLEGQAALPDIMKQAKSDYAACVFLKNNECQVYQVRPTTCRKYHVVSDPKFCDAKTSGGQNVVMAISLNAELMSSAIANVSENGSMAPMLLKAISKQKQKLVEVHDEL